MSGRVTEWQTDSRECVKYMTLRADAQYVRGSRPTGAEVAALERRILAKYPTAEFVIAKRTFVPAVGFPRDTPKRVWWCLEWIVLNGETERRERIPLKNDEHKGGAK